MVIDAEGRVAMPIRLLQQLERPAEALLGGEAVRLHPALASLAGMRQREEREISHAGVRYQLIANAIIDDGQFLGVAVEWRSRALKPCWRPKWQRWSMPPHRATCTAASGWTASRASCARCPPASIACWPPSAISARSAGAAGRTGPWRSGACAWKRTAGVFARMRDDANATVAQHHIVTRIQQAASSLDAGVGEIVAGHHDLSQRTEQQAANLEETAASMHELTDTVVPMPMQQVAPMPWSRARRQWPGVVARRLGRWLRPCTASARPRDGSATSPS